jgi:hypothetical protein
MSPALGVRESASVADLIARLARATDDDEIAATAERIGGAGEQGAVRPLLERLGDRRVQSRPDLADALCRALVALDVVCPCGSCAFAIRPRHLLAPEVVDVITELGPVVPLRYLIARQP